MLLLSEVDVFFPVHPNISIVIFHALCISFWYLFGTINGTDKENLPNSQSILSQKQHRVKKLRVKN